MFLISLVDNNINKNKHKMYKISKINKTLKINKVNKTKLIHINFLLKNNNRILLVIIISNLIYSLYRI